jgi:uncharacterized repeat protein (TIGR02543 family)
MKKTTITLLCAVSFLLAACFSPWRPDEAVLTLNLGGGATNRAVAYPPDKETQNNIEHTIHLSGPEEKDINLKKGVLSVQITVVPGRWDITVQAFLDGALYAEGSGSVVVAAAQNNPVAIQMRYAGIYYHTVSFDSNGGSNVPDQAVESGGYAHQPDDPHLSGYTFDNWYSDAGLTTVYDFSAPVTGDITLYAGWAPVPPGSFTVTFNSNGGSHVSGQVVEAGGTATHPTNPALSGYTFDNWYSDAGLTAVYDFSAPVTGDITLYAKWTQNAANTYTVTFNSNGGTAIEGQEVVDGETAERPAHPTLSGYTFDNWYSDEGLTQVYDFSTPVTGDITLYAKWNPVPPNSFTVTFNSNGGSDVSDQPVESGGTAEWPATPTRDGYTFDNWYSDEGLTLVYDFSTPVTGNITLYAKWIITSVAITVTGPATGETPNTTASGTGNFTCGAVTWTPNDSPFKGSTAYTASVTLTAHANYTFAGLTAATINGPPANIAENTGGTVTLSRTFEPTDAKKVTGIAIQSQPSNMTYTHGDTLNLSGLVVTLTHDDNSTAEVELSDFDSKNISTIPVNGAPLVHLTHNGQPVAVSFGNLTANTNPLTVNPKAITFNVSTTPSQVNYTGSPITPTVTVRDGATTLTLITDYTVGYTNNTNAGTANVTITGTGNYAGSTGSTTFTINKADPTVTWPTGLTATYGQTLSAISLPGNGTGTPAGTFTWTTPTDYVGNAGTQAHSMTFTPDDTENYNTVTNNVNITVSCQVSFDTNGGGSIADQTITTAGAKASRPADPTRANFVFDYWYTDAGFTTPYYFDTVVTSSITLYAKWISQTEIDAMTSKNMVWVSGGTFRLGQNLGTVVADGVYPQSNVTISGFYIGKYEVTQKQWYDVMGTTIEQQQDLVTTETDNYGRGDTYPIYYVNWYEALVFCNKLSMAENLTPAYRISNSTDPEEWGTVPTSWDAESPWNAVTIDSGSTGYRLPTEAQWEYAAKGGNPLAPVWVGYTYAGSDTVDDVAWYKDNSGSASHAVGTLAPNGLGLYDMSGNVSEWCWDRYGNYTSTDKTDPTGASSGSSDRVVLRGGLWDSPAVGVRSAYRADGNARIRNEYLGFRLARAAQ